MRTPILLALPILAVLASPVLADTTKFVPTGSNQQIDFFASVNPDCSPAGLPVVRLIGVLEIAGALGLILPPLPGIVPALAIAAAVCFVVLQALATALHLSRGEGSVTWLNVVLIVMAGVAAWLATAF